MKRLHRQRGVAVITALLLTTLAVTIVASLFWSQQVQVRSMENQRLHLQTKWILRGALDWARLVLRQDGMDTRTYTSLTSVWNTPLAETRLDQYIERERVEGEVFDASLSGRIVDATSRYNLTNLATGPKVNVDHLAVYKRLLVNLQLDPALAERTAKLVAASAPPLPREEGDTSPVVVRTGAPIALTQLDDLLAIQGYTPAIVDKLRQFAIVLPADAVTVNVNTAAPEVIAALLPNFSVSQANALVERRKQAYYRQKSDFVQQLYGAPAQEALFDVKSEYFLVLSRVRLDRAALDAEALVNRKLDDQTFKTSTVWVRQN
ncbi:type II secretion system minor pseudopilin GspK [Massilia sp. CF038]|uniref:type II secretion system minor pseudopilin GspK n=1 Tax=Massilia sp. CF038 TaxID=1881045 RepID=UPI000923C167|nr:type II secretion system minor pseudopilin GspK [Massilia sp. CF038]SHH39997.1 type II secretion system protein K (GspK) [Massilia sp. CF038]